MFRVALWRSRKKKQEVQLMPKYNNYFRFLVEEIHTTIVATVDDDGLPVTAAIDMMDYDKKACTC